MRRLGKSHTPRGQYGINMNFQYKGFYLSMLFEGSTAFEMHPRRCIHDADRSGWSVTNCLQVSGRAAAFLSNSNAVNPCVRTQHRFECQQQLSEQRLLAGKWCLSAYEGLPVRLRLQICIALWRKLAHPCQVGISGQNIFTISHQTNLVLDPRTSSTEGYRPSCKSQYLH